MRQTWIRRQFPTRGKCWRNTTCHSRKKSLRMLKIIIIDLHPGDSQLMKGEYGNGKLPRVILKVCLGWLPKQRSRLGGGGRKPLGTKLEEVRQEWIESRRSWGSSLLWADNDESRDNASRYGRKQPCGWQGLQSSQRLALQIYEVKMIVTEKKNLPSSARSRKRGS